MGRATGKRLLRAAQTARPISRMPATMASVPGLEMRMSPAPMPLRRTMPLMVCSRAAVTVAGAMASEGEMSRGSKGDERGRERHADQRDDQQIDRQAQRGNAMEIDRHGKGHRQLDQRRDQQQLKMRSSEPDQSGGRARAAAAEKRLQMAGDQPQRDAKLRQRRRQVGVDAPPGPGSARRAGRVRRYAPPREPQSRQRSAPRAASSGSSRPGSERGSKASRQRAAKPMALRLLRSRKSSRASR